MVVTLNDARRAWLCIGAELSVVAGGIGVWGLETAAEVLELELELRVRVRLNDEDDDRKN